MESVSGTLKFYDTFPSKEMVKSVARRHLPKGTTITEKAVLNVLRHNYTNYHDLLRSRRFDYESMKAEVNRIIAEEISGWDKKGDI